MNLNVNKQQTVLTSKQYVDLALLNVSTDIITSLSDLSTNLKEIDTSLTNAITTLDTSAKTAIDNLDSSVLTKLADIYTKDEIDTSVNTKLNDYVTTENLKTSLGIGEGEENKTISDVIDEKVDAAVADLIGEAPKTLDTLKEIADALNNDASAYTTIVNKIDTLDSSVSDAIDALKESLTETATLKISVTDMLEDIPGIDITQIDDEGTESDVTVTELKDIFNKYYTGKLTLLLDFYIDESKVLKTYLPVDGTGIKIMVNNYTNIIIKIDNNDDVLCDISTTEIAYPEPDNDEPETAA